jgi:hypothetical protein
MLIHEANDICCADSFSRMRELTGVPIRPGQQEYNNRDHYDAHL